MAAPILSITPIFGDGDTDACRIAPFAAAADAAGFDLLLLGYAGAPVDMDPLAIASALCAATRRIGLGAAVTTALGEPFTLARAFSALDHLSAGRSAWQIVPHAPPAVAPFAYRAPVDPAEEGPRAREFVAVASALWDSWEAGALMDDKANADFSDPAKVRRIDHDGDVFQVRGPLNCPAPRQGRPLIVQSGDGDPAWLAATADVVVAIAGDEAHARAQGEMLHGLARAQGRALRVLVETSGPEAAARRGWLCDGARDGLHILAPIDAGDRLHALADRIGERRAGAGDLRSRLGLPR